MKRTVRILIGILVIGLSGCRTGLASPQAATADPGVAGPVIHSPTDSQRIGAPGDPLCPEPDRPCNKIRAEGWIPEKRTAFFAVEPLLASPRKWIQPPIHGVRSDGSLSGLIYLGEAQNGAAQHFKIYLFACEDQNRFKEGEEILQFPQDCQVSEPVEVYREH